MKDTEKYFAEIAVVGDNQYKVVLAKKLTNKNQYSRTWKRVDAREFARQLNRSNLVIK